MDTQRNFFRKGEGLATENSQGSDSVSPRFARNLSLKRIAEEEQRERQEKREKQEDREKFAQYYKLQKPERGDKRYV